jgi:parvulin-like peptidyl-prolyl isomerase
MNGLEIIKVAKHRDTGKTIFYFETGERLDELIRQYKENEFLRKLNESMKEVRSMI